MSKRSGGNVIDVSAQGRQLPEQAPEETDLEDASIARFLIERADGISDAQVKVYRAAGSAAPGGGAKAPRDAFLYACTPDDFSEEFIQGEYGPGSYRLKMYGTHGGNFGLLVNRLLEIGPAPKSKMPVPAAAAPGVNVNVPGGDAAALAKAIAEANAPIMAAMMAMLQKLAGDGGGGRRQALEEIKELMTIAGLGQRNTPDPITQLTSVLALAKQLSPDGGGGGDGAERGPYDVILKAIDTFGGMIAGKAPGAPAALPAPNPAPTTAAPAAPAEVPEDDAVKVALKLQLSLLLNAARANSDPGVYATLIYEQAPDEVLDVLESPQWYETLIGMEPGFAAFKPWAEKVRELVVGAIRADAEPPAGAAASPVTQLTPGSQAGNVVGNAATTPGVTAAGTGPAA